MESIDDDLFCSLKSKCVRYDLESQRAASLSPCQMTDLPVCTTVIYRGGKAKNQVPLSEPSNVYDCLAVLSVRYNAS